ncbi:unnamed protein product [Dicrocoelium dendriticum]|nr:unnamed protein product [Dicrocoelium dendriticum]
MSARNRALFHVFYWPPIYMVGGLGGLGGGVGGGEPKHNTAHTAAETGLPPSSPLCPPRPPPNPQPPPPPLPDPLGPPTRQPLTPHTPPGIPTPLPQTPSNYTPTHPPKKNPPPHHPPPATSTTTPGPQPPPRRGGGKHLQLPQRPPLTIVPVANPRLSMAPSAGPWHTPLSKRRRDRTPDLDQKKKGAEEGTPTGDTQPSTRAS